MDTNSGKKYDLDRRTFFFARSVREYVDKFPKQPTNTEIGRQLIGSAGSVGASYIEAYEALSRKDFIMRIKICKKEAKETRYWLELSTPCMDSHVQKSQLIRETTELIKIFATIVHKTKV